MTTRSKTKKSVLGTGTEFGWVGSTAEQKNSSSALDLQGAKDTNLQVDKPKRQKISVYMDSSTAMELKMQAVREGRSASAIVEELVYDYCESKKG